MLLEIIRQEIVNLEQQDNPSQYFKTFKDCLIANNDIGIVKESLRNYQIERTGMELLLGFHSEVDVSFDLYLQEEFYAHFDIQKEKFIPLAKKNEKYSVLPLINLPYMKDTYIKNVSVEIYSPEKLFLIGAKLKHETYRKEITLEPYRDLEMLEV